ncbi:FtsW/RodA/SpoVE family cell cycle protein, partial [Algoriphagus aestuarii]|nr:FtsW/RodA/SpoVE family cell cycle protein [Algoriphagus aestuarii]
MKALPARKAAPDFLLISVLFTLLALGLVMVYSASAVWADYRFDDSFYFAKRQMLFAL